MQLFKAAVIESLQALAAQQVTVVVDRYRAVLFDFQRFGAWPVLTYTRAPTAPKETP